MSYWNACTSSWPSTWSVSAYEPSSGIAIRCFAASVTPCTPSLIAPPTTVVCWKSGWLA
jgi:hypothetical protein